MKRLAFAAAALLLLAGRAHGVKVEHILSPLSGQPQDVAAERLLIKFSTGADAGEKAAVLAAVHGTIAKEMPDIGWTVVQLTTGASVVPALRAAMNMPGVDRVAPDSVMRLHAFPSDPLVPQQFNLYNTDAFSGWDITTGQGGAADGKPVTVVMIDAGIDGTNQPDVDTKLTDVIYSGVPAATQSQFFDPDNSGAQATDSKPTAACVHGTETASVAAAATSNGAGVAGVSWGAQLISLKVFNNADCNSDCSDALFVNSCTTTDSAIADALDYVHNTLKGVSQLGHMVVNISIGGSGSCAVKAPSTQTALGLVVGDGVPVTISAGNDGSSVNNPANCAGTGGVAAGIIPVGATTAGNKLAYFSSNGAELAAHGVVAPGENIPVDSVSGKTTTNSGTSFSAPFVAGMCALMLAEKPTLTAGQIETYIRGGANNIGLSSNQQGAGQVNVFRSLRLAQNGTLATFEGDQKAIAFPNPLRLSQNATATITIPTSLQGGNPSIRIYAADGVLVRELAGSTWDGKNGDGAFVASGTYVFLVKTDKGTTRGRVAVIR